MFCRPFRTCRAAITLAATIGALLTMPAVGSAAQAPVGLGTAGSFAVLAGSTVTNTGPSTINGNLGVHPGTAVTGFPPGTVNGTIHAADAAANQAKVDLQTAYDDAASRGPAVTVAGDLGGLTVTSGVYRSAGAIGLTGTITLDAQGDPDAVFIFQAGSTLTTAVGSRVNLVNGAQSCNVFWQVGSSATLDTGSTFAGSILALMSITLNNSVTLDGRALARNGAVTLDTDTITAPTCRTAGTIDGGTGGGDEGGGGEGGGGDTGTGGTGEDDVDGGGGGAVRNGTAILTTTPVTIRRFISRFGTSRCIRRRFSVNVRGLAIRRVVYTVNRKVVARRSNAPFGVALAATPGVRVVRAHVTYKDATAPVTLTLRYRGCAPRALLAPIRPPGFTG